jgi:hypothetical protein
MIPYGRALWSFGRLHVELDRDASSIVAQNSESETFDFKFNSLKTYAFIQKWAGFTGSLFEPQLNFY